MIRFQGKGVYGAVASGKISVFKRQDIQVKREKIEDTKAEMERLENAKSQAVEQLQEIYEKALKEVGETNAQIFEIHMMMIEDEDYNDSIAEMINGQNLNAEYAVAITADNFYGNGIIIIRTGNNCRTGYNRFVKSKFIRC